MRPQPRVWQEQTHECSHHGHTGNHPAFPAQWFYGVLRALPGDEFVLPPSLPDWRLVEPGRARFASDSLAPATGARTTRLGRTQKAPIILRAALRSRGSSRPAIAFSRLTPSRPPHPMPNVRDDRETPLLWAGTGRISELICARREAKYFCKRGLTPVRKIRSSDLPVGQNGQIHRSIHAGAGMPPNSGARSMPRRKSSARNPPRVVRHDVPGDVRVFVILRWEFCEPRCMTSSSGSNKFGMMG
jgi:hypothetical protein